jgi:lipopolysaccharide transport system ATP-binding protein
VELHGRVGSLLEVGTGFHPEMTGRENIFLNGSILGMKKTEIEEKFDEIVKFSEIEKFLDTPVKRYSSGMYVRLAFAVAAHLEPEILLVDEVLAVGDAQFQKKCLGKMGEVAKEGRTVLFVSHSMPMISSLCNRCVLLNNGKIQMEGVTGEVIASYLISDTGTPAFVDYRMSPSPPGDNLAILLSAWIENISGERAFEININESFRICMQYRVLKDVPKIPYPNFHIYDNLGQCVFITSPIMNYNQSFKAGEYYAECEIPGNFLNDGLFSVDLALTFSHSGIQVSFWEKHALSINITDPIDDTPTRSTGYSGRIPGVVRPHLKWNMECVQ